MPANIVWKPVLTDSAAIHTLVLEANAHPDCAGVITWMLPPWSSPAPSWRPSRPSLRPA